MMPTGAGQSSEPPSLSLLPASPAPASWWQRRLPSQLAAQIGKRTLLMRLVVNASWLVADKLIRLGVGLFVTVWIARYLGPENFGLYTYGQGLILLFTGVASLGLPDLLLRDLAARAHDARQIQASAFLLRLIGATMAIAAIVATVLAVRGADRDALAVCVIFAVSLLPQAADVIDQGFQSQEKVHAIILLRNGTFLVMAVAKATLLWTGVSITTLAATFTVEYLIVAIGMWVLARRSGAMFGWRDVRAAEVARLARSCLPLAVRLMAIGIYMKIDQLVIERTLGDIAVGLYGAATRVSEIWYFVPTAIMTALTPRLALLRKSGAERFEQRLVLTMRALFWFAVAVCGTLSILAPFVISTLFGAAFAPAAAVLSVYAWTGVFVAIGVAGNIWFIVENRLRYGLAQAVIGALVSLLANLILVPRFGVMGGAYAALASYSVSAVLLNAAFAGTRPLLYLQIRAVTFR